MNDRLITQLALEVSKWHRQSRLAVERLVRKTEGWQTNTTLKFKVNNVYDMAQSIIRKRNQRAKPQIGKTLHERYALTKRKRFLDSVRAASFRTSTTDIHITRVNFVSDIDKVSVECNEIKTRRGKIMSIHDYFPHDTIHKLSKHLRVIDGRLTLYVSKHETCKNIELYDAVWCQQNTGTSLRLVQGCIAVRLGKKLYATHVEGAWEPLTREKALAAEISTVIERPQRKQREFSFVEEIYGNRIKVSSDQLKKIEKWCWSVGLNPESTRLTLGDLIRGYWVQPNSRIKSLIRKVFTEVTPMQIAGKAVHVGDRKFSVN